MSQNDFVIANASGSTVRADINSAFAAIASQSSGATAPATTYANQWWHDDATDILKIRDEANTAWINVASKVGTTWIPYNSGTLIGTMANLAYTAITQNLVLSAKNVQMASTAVASGTPDFSTSGNTVSLSGTATANTLGTVQAGFIGVVHYGIAITITHNAVSRILPTAANIVTAVGDVEVVLSLGSGNWRTVGYMRASGAALVGSAATQAEEEAGSSTTVFTTPGRQHFHPSAVKWWWNLDGTGVIATRVTYNITSSTDGGVGNYTATIATDFSTADWAFFTGANTTVVGNLTTNVVHMRSTDSTAMTAGTLQVQTGNSSTGGAADTDVLCLGGFGDQ